MSNEKTAATTLSNRAPALAFAPVPALPFLLSATADKGVQARKRRGKGELTVSFFQ